MVRAARVRRFVQFVQHYEDLVRITGTVIALRVQQTEDLLELLCGDIVFGNALDNVQHQINVRGMKLVQVLWIRKTPKQYVEQQINEALILGSDGDQVELLVL